MNELHQLMTARLSLARAFGRDAQENYKKYASDYNTETVVSAIQATNTSGEMKTAIEIPYIFTDTESAKAAILDKMPELILTGKGAKDENKAEIANALYHCAVDKTGMEEVTEDVLMNYYPIGMGIFKSGWKTRTKKVTETTQQPVVDEMGQEVGVQDITQSYDVPIYDDVFLESVDPEKLYFSPDSKFSVDGGKIPYMIEEYSMSPEEIENEFGVKLDTQTTIDLNKLKLSEDLPELSNDTAKSDIKRITVYEYWGVMSKDQAKKIKSEESWMFDKIYHVVFTASQVLKSEESPYNSKPYRFCGKYGLPKDFFKYGEARVMRQLEQELSIRRSQMVDYADRFANPHTVMSTATEVDETAWKSPKAGAIAKYDGQTPPQYVTPPPMPEIIAIASQEARNDLQLISRTLDMSKGGNQTTVSTATGQTILNEAAEKKYRRDRRIIARALKSIVRFMLELQLQNYPDEKIIAITDKDGQEVSMTMQEIRQSMEGFGTEYDIDIEPESLTNNKDVARAQAIELYNMSKNDPLFNRDELIKDLMMTGFGKKNPDRFITKPIVPEGTPVTLPDGSQMIVDNQGKLQPAPTNPQPTGSTEVPMTQGGISGSIQ